MKKTISIFLAVLMLLSMLPTAAFAAAGTENQVRYFADDEGLWGIDFADVIQDKSTINQGKIVLVFPGDTDEAQGAYLDEYAEIDEDGVARFFFVLDDGEKVYDSIPLGIYAWKAELRAVNGNLFDNVASYAFSLEDVYERLNTETFQVDNDYPLVKVTRQEGDLVKEMELSFASDDSSILPLTVDMDKEIELTVYLLADLQRTYALIPVRYDDGVLTVSVRNSDGSEGVALHDAVITVDHSIYSSLYIFAFVVPYGLFRYKNMVSEGFRTTEYSGLEIMGMPVQEVMNLHLSKTMTRIIELVGKIVPSSMQTLVITLLFPLVFPFPIIRLSRAARKTFTAYGFDYGAMVKDAIRSGGLKNALKILFDPSL